jgi:hypothetical protein
MGHNSSAEEVQQEHLGTLGPNLGPVYHALYNECAWLHIKWQQYVELYGTKPERIKLLNKSASLFFRIIEDILWDDILLHLSKLTDPPGSGKKKQRLTIRRLPNLISDETFRSEVENLVDSAVKATEFARDWRNRRIAHRNLALAIKETSISLAPASRKQIKDALEAISRPIQRINEFYFNSQIRFGLISEPKGAIDLLYVMHEGIQAREKRRQRLRKGIIQKEDMEPPTEL